MIREILGESSLEEDRLEAGERRADAQVEL